jgi:hypothetical protein
MQWLYNPMVPGWLGYLLAAGLAGLGIYELTQVRRGGKTYWYDLLIGIGLWATTAITMFVTIELEAVNGDIAGFTAAQSSSNPPAANTPFPSPSAIVTIAAWVVPIVAVLVFAYSLVLRDWLLTGITLVAFCASFTLLAFVMLLSTLADNWALATSYSWMATAVSVVVLLVIVAFTQRTQPDGSAQHDITLERV